MNILLVPLMGLPCCGKTTLCEEIVKKNYKLNEPSKFLIFSYDDFIPLSIQSKYASENERPSEQKLSLAKSLRTMFIKTIEFIVKDLKVENIEESLLSNSSNSSNNNNIAKELEKFLTVKELDQQLSNLQLLSNDKNNGISNDLDSSYFVDLFKTKLLDIIKSFNIKEYHNVIILIDDNNYYHSMRNEIYQIAKKYNTSYCILYPISTLEDCIKRNNSLRKEDINQIPEEVIQIMSKKLEEPDPLRNNCDMYCIQITNIKDERIHKEIQQTFESALANPIDIQQIDDRTEEIEKERRICAENEIHQADQILRKWIHTQTITMKLAPSSPAGGSANKGKDSLKLLTEKLLKKKNIILDGLKSGEIQIQSNVSDYLGFQQEILQLANSNENDS